ncbi:MAG TPA: hypothetical protein H9716_05985 [Candidatus Enterocloster faecavium]|uniref:Uncharacterized protein n=1 Tax=Candidatus Enterocloster faecavium TaxID=2838560 RepID=A0A9D2RM10_9FIRM|nr:hypothetical protein [Candidatus Enterocloster faecavium]
MTVQNVNNDSRYIGFEYREVMVPKEFVSLYMDSYPCFGWEADPNRTMMPENGLTAANGKGANAHDGQVLYFRRNRSISNKAELTRLQRNFDSCIKEIETLNRSKITEALTVSLFVGILGTAFMAGSVFAVTAEPPMFWLMVLLAVPGLAGWIFPCFLYRMLARKKETELYPLIEQKYDEICTICEKGNNLIYI